MDAATSIRVHRLRLRGNTERQHSILSSLERAVWPPIEPDGYLFLRKLHVHGSSAEIGPRAAFAAAKLAEAAVDGWSDAAETALAVRFSGQAELLACLLRDRLSGEARLRWFWRDWQRYWRLPLDQAVAGLLAEAALALPAVMHRLALAEGTAMLWRSLEPAGAAAVLAHIERITGWPLASAPSPAGAATAGIEPGETRQFPWPAGLALLPPSDPRVRLAAVLQLWRCSPQRLTASDAAAAVAAVAEAMVMQATNADAANSKPMASVGLREPPTPPILQEANPTIFAPQIQTQPVAVEQPNAADLTAIQPAVASPSDIVDETTPDPNLAAARLTPPRPQAPAPGIQFVTDEAHGQTDAGDSQTTPGQIAPASAKALGAKASNPPQPSAAEAFAVTKPRLDDDSRIITRQGGWFFLLNALKLKAVQTLLSGEIQADYATGWLWLYQLGRALGAVADGPLLRFLAEESGIEAGQMDCLPAPVALPEILQLGLNRFGASAWTAESLSLPAVIVRSRSHLDIHFRLHDAKLDVRRVGLDINPGWLPWLGRVVNFHYGFPPALNEIDP